MRIEDWVFDRFRSEMDDTFRAFLAETRPGAVPVNVWADEEKVVVIAEVPGVRPESLDVSVTGETLVLKARRAAEVEPGGAAENGHENRTSWLRRERLTGEVSRTLTLPYRVESDAVDARVADGVLTLVFPRAAEDKPRRIAVKAG